MENKEKRKTFKTKSLPLAIISFCLEKPRCSREIAYLMKKSVSDRNIHKAILKLEKENLLIEKDHFESQYPKSRFFIANLDQISIELMKMEQIYFEKVKNSGCDISGVKLRSKEQMIKDFVNSFEKTGSYGKCFLNINVFHEGYNKQIKISEIRG